MLSATVTERDGTRIESEDIRRQLRHGRYCINAMVGLVRDGIPERMFVHALNLSWGGAMLRVPNVEIAKKDSVLLRFPGANNDAIYTRAEVIWSSLMDDQKRLIGVRFTKLRLTDEEKLRRVLSILALSQSKAPHTTCIEGQIEIRLADREEVLFALGQIHNGFLETRMSGPIRSNEPFPVAVSGFGDTPVLHLRTHVLASRPRDLRYAAETSGAQRVTLALEHPIEDLRRVTNPVISLVRGYDDLSALEFACARILERGGEMRIGDTEASASFGVGADRRSRASLH